MILAMMLHHVPDGGRVKTIGHIVHLDRFSILLFQCVPYGIASIRYNLCEHNHNCSFDLVCTFVAIFSSMLYQCWISPATASIHQRMNFSFLKNRAFSSAVFLDSTLLIFIKSVLAMARELRASTSSLVSLMGGRCFKPVSTT